MTVPQFFPGGMTLWYVAKLNSQQQWNMIQLIRYGLPNSEFHVQIVDDTQSSMTVLTTAVQLKTSY